MILKVESGFRKRPVPDSIRDHAPPRTWSVMMSEAEIITI
jgi:hypothetical protein